MLVLATFLAAQEAPVMVVTGAKVAQNIEETVEAVEVISSEEIAATGAKNVAEVMATIPGVVIFDHPQATVMMQGFDGSYVKILVNGMEITGDTGGATPVNMIPVADIERIEIVRGASSVLYGSDAMGGVINIITKKPEKGKFSLLLKQELTSTLRTYSEGHIGYANDLFGFSLSGSFDRDKGKTRAERNNYGKYIDIYEIAAARLSSARAAVSWYHPRGELELYGSWMDSLLNVSATVANHYDFMNTKLEGGVKETFHLSDTAMLDGFFSYRQLDYDADWIEYGSTVVRSVYADSLFRDIEGEARFAWEPTISHALLFGVNAKREALESESFTEEKTLVMLSVFVQDTWNIGGADKFRVVPGLRFDYRVPNDSDEDPVYKLSPKLSLRYDPSENLVLRLSYGMGFKTPTLKQNYWVFFHPTPYNFLLIGNPELKSESSHGINASADYKITETLGVSAGAYFNYVYDLIDDYISDGNPGSMLNPSGVLQTFLYTRGYRNVGRAITSGGDLSLRFNGSRLKSSLTYSYTLAREYDQTEKTWTELAGRVPHQISASVSYLIPVVETSVQTRITWNSPQLIGSEMGSSATDNYRTPDFLMVNLRISKMFFDEKFELYAGVQNLLSNFHFVKSTDPSQQNQEDYYGLRYGRIFSIGAVFKW
ncbi:MAG: TonB-dependent receptor [Treponema sp.]|jgi:outer membrane receptor for ferrienterochelin and colicins|nr:TonB-dependent receptor [Treponema sp.]